MLHNNKIALATIAKIQSFVIESSSEYQNLISGEPVVKADKTYEFFTVAWGRLFWQIDYAGYCRMYIDTSAEYPKEKISQPITKKEAINLHSVLADMAPEASARWSFRFPDILSALQEAVKANPEEPTEPFVEYKGMTSEDLVDGIASAGYQTKEAAPLLLALAYRLGLNPRDDCELNGCIIDDFENHTVSDITPDVAYAIADAIEDIHGYKLR